MRSSKLLLIVLALILCSVSVLATESLNPSQYFIYDDFNTSIDANWGAINYAWGASYGIGSNWSNGGVKATAGVDADLDRDFINLNDVTACIRMYDEMNTTAAMQSYLNIRDNPVAVLDSWVGVSTSSNTTRYTSYDGVSNQFHGNRSLGWHEFCIYNNNAIPLVQFYIDSVNVRNSTSAGLIDKLSNRNTVAGQTNLGYKSDVFRMWNGSFNMMPQNTNATSIIFWIYDESTALPITQLVNVNVFNNISSVDWNITGGFGTINIPYLPSSVAFSSVGYTERSYIINQTNRSMNIYLLSSNDSTVFTTLDEENPNIVIPNVLMNIYTYVNNSLVLIMSKRTDITGRLQLYYRVNKRYIFSVEADNYLSKAFELNPIIFSAYDVPMKRISSADINTGDYTGVKIVISPYQYFNNATNNVSYLIYSPTSLLTSYYINITYSRNNYSLQFRGTNSSGELFTTTFNISNATQGDKVYFRYGYNLTDGTSNNYMITFSIDAPSAWSWLGQKSDIEAINLFDRLLIMTLIIGFITALVYFVAGMESALMASALLFGFFVFTSFMPIWGAIISIIMLVLLIAWGVGR